jgi:hypothetical protein
MLDWYIGEHMVSVVNITNGLKEPTCGYFDTSQKI